MTVFNVNESHSLMNPQRITDHLCSSPELYEASQLAVLGFKVLKRTISIISALIGLVFRSGSRLFSALTNPFYTTCPAPDIRWTKLVASCSTK